MKSSYSGNNASNVVLKKINFNTDSSYCEFQPYTNQIERNKNKQVVIKHPSSIKSINSSINLRGSKSETEGLHFNTPRKSKPKPPPNVQTKVSVTTVELNLTPPNLQDPKLNHHPDQLKSSFKTFSQKNNSRNGKIQSNYHLNTTDKYKSKIPHLQTYKKPKATSSSSRGETENFSDLDFSMDGISSNSRAFNEHEKLVQFMKNEMTKLQPKTKINPNDLDGGYEIKNSSRTDLGRYFENFGKNDPRLRLFSHIDDQDSVAPLVSIKTSKQNVFNVHFDMIEENQKLLNENKRLQLERKTRLSNDQPLITVSDDFEEITGKKISEQLPKIAEKLNQNARFLVNSRRERLMPESYDDNIADLTLGLFSKSENPKKPSCPRFTQSTLTKDVNTKTRKLKEIGEKNEKFAATLDTLSNRLNYLREKYSKIPSTGNVNSSKDELNHRDKIIVATKSSKKSVKYKSIDDFGNDGIGDVIVEKTPQICREYGDFDSQIKETPKTITQVNEPRGDVKLNFHDIDSLLINLQEQEKDLDSILQKNQELDELIAKNRLGKLQSYNWKNAMLEEEISKGDYLIKPKQSTEKDISEKLLIESPDSNEENEKINRYFVQDNNVFTTSGFVISPIFDETTKNQTTSTKLSLIEHQPLEERLEELPQSDLGHHSYISELTEASENYNEINNLQDFFDQQKPNSHEINNLFSENYKSMNQTYTTEKTTLINTNSEPKILPITIDKVGFNKNMPTSVGDGQVVQVSGELGEIETNDQGIQANFNVENDNISPFNIQSCLKVNYKNLYSQLMKSQYLKADLNLVSDSINTNNSDQTSQGTLSSSSTFNTSTPKSQESKFDDQIADFLKASTKELKDELTETSIRLNEDIKNLELMTLFVKNENELSLQKKEIREQVEDEYCQLKKTLSKISEVSTQESVVEPTDLNALQQEIEDVLRSPRISEIDIKEKRDQEQLCCQIEYDSILKRLDDDITRFKTSKFQVVLPSLRTDSQKQKGGDDGSINSNITPKDLKQFSTILKNPQGKSMIKRPKSKKQTFKFDGCYSKVLDASPLGDINIDTEFQAVTSPKKNRPVDDVDTAFVPTRLYRRVASDIKRMCRLRKESMTSLVPKNLATSGGFGSKKFPSLESTTPTIQLDNGGKLGYLQPLTLLPKRKKSSNLADAMKKKLPTLRLVPLVDMQHLRNDAKILNQIENFDLCKAIVKPETEETIVEQQRFSLKQSSQISLKNLIDRY